MTDTTLWALVLTVLIASLAGVAAVVGSVYLALRRIDSGHARERAKLQEEIDRCRGEWTASTAEGNALHYADQEIDRLNTALTRSGDREALLFRMVTDALTTNRQATVVTGHAVDITAQAQAVAAQAVAAATKPPEGNGHDPG